MARSRNIKPSIMDNEELAELEPLTRLLFIYLWMLADREGRVEDRPKRIAAQAFPYDRKANVPAMLTNLQAAGFIDRYVADGVSVIQILSFIKHQTPHGTERDSLLPGRDGRYTIHKRGKNGYSTGEVTLTDSALTVKKLSENTLNHESGFLNPDSLNHECGATAPLTLPEEYREALKSRPELDPNAVYRKFLDHKPEKQRTLTTWKQWVADERAPVTAAVSDPDSRASVEALGQSLGLGRWDESKEQFATYKARVRGHGVTA